MKFIETRGLSHKFNIRDKDGNKVGENWAIDGVDFEADRGQIVAILGRNGSGKSTFARHLNGLLVADRGTVYIGGEALADGELYEIRRTVGMVFQNPDNQIVGTTLAEDVGFGLENIGAEPHDIWGAVEEMLELTGLSAYIDKDTSHLSGGQKQRLAIASVMAMKPQCIVLDEATSMLDHKGADEMIRLVEKINRENGITVIMVTHKVGEAKTADRVYVLDGGKVVASGSPDAVLGDVQSLVEYGLEVPLYMRMNADVPVDITFEYKKGAKSGQNVVVDLKNVSYTYKKGNSTVKALNDINVEIYRGQVVSVIGHTGSGKSTMLQLFNRLLVPDEGTVRLFGEDISKIKNLKSLRSRIGYVFQFPESQLFESTVIRDVMYGPMNFGMDKASAQDSARRALKMVGIPDRYFEYSPFELSGGMKKRVALAGILAYKPELLILDEPACGLDGESKRSLFDIIRRLNREKNCTIIFVSHDMEDVYEMTERVIVLDEGSIIYDGSTEAFFSDEGLSGKCCVAGSGRLDSR